MKLNLFIYSVILIFFISLVSIILPFINGKIVIINEFFNIPDFGFMGNTIQSSTSDIIQGISNNILKLRLLPYKILEGMFFHHHMSFIEPAWLLSQSDNTPIHQYGILTSILISSLATIFNSPVSLDFYMKINYGSYIVFYIFITILLFKNINNKLNIILYLALSILLIYTLGFLILYMTPTVSPLRQIFSPLIIIMILYYFKSNNILSFYSILGILLVYSFYNFHMSLFICFSIFLIYFIDYISEKNNIVNRCNTVKTKKNLVLSFIFFSTILILNVYFDFNSNNTFSEIGIFFGSGLKFSSILFIVMILSIFYFVLVYSESFKMRDYQIQFLCFFSSLSLIFYAWNPSIVHFSQIFWIVLFTVIFWLDKYVVINKVFSSFAIAMIFIMLIPAYEMYNFKKNFYYDEIIKEAKVYKWNFPNAKINSTINPDFIKDSCNLFKNYSNNNNIIMISEYDLFLPYVCGFNNKGFYPQLGQGLISEKYLSKAVKFYKSSKFEYIFVDKAIAENSMDKTNFGFYSMISDYVYKKINYISQIKKTFDILSNDFILVKKGKLVNVYKRKFKE